MIKRLGQGARVLVVDDNAAMLKLIGALLADEGMQPTLVGGAAQARSALDGATTPFELVLTDVSMPGESGFDLLQWIKRHDSPHREVPVLLMTAQLPEPANRMRSLAMGAVDYVERPDDPYELVLRTAKAVAYHRRVRSLEASLADSERQAMVGRLLAASHHEIKNLATLVQLAAQQTIQIFGGEARGADGDGPRALAALAQSTALLSDVSRSITSLLEPGAMNVRPLDLASLAREVQELMKARVAPLMIELAVKGRDVLAMGHEVRLKQVLINLILNAAEATRELAADEGGVIRVTVLREGPGCALVVQDDGIGFPAAGERRAFKAFESTKSLRGGQGLGLWLGSTLVENMGGSLTLSSAGPGLGATARLELPEASPLTARDTQEIDIDAYLTELAPL